MVTMINMRKLTGRIFNNDYQNILLWQQKSGWCNLTSIFVESVAGDKSDYITGATLDVTGGMLMR